MTSESRQPSMTEYSVCSSISFRMVWRLVPQSLRHGRWGKPIGIAPQIPPIKPLGAVFAKSKELLGAVSAVRALPGGKVLVNDINGRKVVLFDSTLSSSTLVADTTSATANAYSSRAGGLIPWKGDSTLFVDPLSLSMLVIDGKGNITRVMSVPRASDVNLLIGGPNGTPGTDAAGRTHRTV